jgi:hypothetical protein
LKRKLKQRTILTSNLYEDVAVEIQIEEKSNLILENGMILFERPVTDKVLQAIENFNSGIKLNILQYTQSYKRRRAEMLMAKQQEQK